MNALTKLRNHKPLAMFRLLGEGMLRKGFLVEVKAHIVVRVTGTSYAASYFRMPNSTELLPRNLALRDDHRESTYF